MNCLKNILVVTTSLAFLAACSSVDLEKTRMMPSKGTAFQKSLHKEYTLLAFLEDDEGDSDDAVYFNNKAMMAAAGNKVGPQKIKERKLPGNTKWELDAARRALVAELLSGGMDKKPAEAVRAQAMFDCWMQEQEENDQPQHIARCRNAFDQALNNLGKAPMTRVMAASAPAGLPPVPGPFTVFFPFDSAALDAKAKATIKKAGKLAKAAKVTGLILNGHADRSGSNMYNMKLSQTRLDVVEISLYNARIPGNVSVIRSPLGEDFPVVKTKDGMKEAKNRRVDIKFRR